MQECFVAEVRARQADLYARTKFTEPEQPITESRSIVEDICVEKPPITEEEFDAAMTSSAGDLAQILEMTA